MKATPALTQNAKISYGGGDISGGGTLVKIQGRAPILLDFLTIEPDFEEILGNESWSVPVKFTDSPRELIQGIKVSPSSLSPEGYKLLQERLSLWEGNSPRTVEIIRRRLDRSSWRMSRLSLKKEFDRLVRQAPFFEEDTVENTFIVGAGIGGFGILVNYQAWEKILRGITSRAGFLAHEALRLEQLEYGSVSTDNLQSIVARLLLRNPCKIAELDELLSEHTIYPFSSPSPLYLKYFDLSSSGLQEQDLERASTILVRAQKKQVCDFKKTYGLWLPPACR